MFHLDCYSNSVLVSAFSNLYSDNTDTISLRNINICDSPGSLQLR